MNRVKSILTVLFTFVALGVYAQCTPNPNILIPGLSPVDDSLACIERGVAYDEIIYFKNYDSLDFQGQRIRVEWIRIDTIGNAPTGLSWETNKTDNTFQNQENGCIRVWGTTNDWPGQYKLKIIVTAKVNILPVPLQQNADALGLAYRLRVINTGETCPDVDTTGASDVYAFIPSRASNNFEIKAQPNPATNQTVLFVNGNLNGDFELRVFNILGAEVVSRTVSLTAGENRISLDLSGFEAGSYFYSLSNGVSTANGRLVVSGK